jgi:hypothetical protein
MIEPLPKARSIWPSAASSRSAGCPRQHPVHLDAVGEADDHLVDQLIAADGPRDRGHFHVGRHSRDEMGRVKLAQLGVTTAAGQHRNMIDIGVRDHRRERLIGVFGVEFVADVLFPERTRSRCACPVMPPPPDRLTIADSIRISPRRQ